MRRYKNDMVVNEYNKSPSDEHVRKYKRLYLLYLYLDRVTPARVDKVSRVTLTALTIQSKGSISGSN